MNEIETVLRTRLHSLAEDLTGATTAASHASSADSARARFRRRRRTRTGLALAAAAVVATVVSVPVIGESSSADPGRDAAHPAPTASATPSDTESADISQRRAEQAATAARLESLAEDLRVALQARATPLSLDAPAAAGSCAERAPTVNSAFGATLAEHSSGAAEGDCVWRTPDGDLQVALGFMAGGTVDQIHTDVDAETARAGCLPSALPGSVTFTAVALCPEDGGTGWHFRIMDTTGTGFWVLSVTVGDQRPQDPAATVAAVLDAADADL
jgi:hypothetical protein